VLLIRKYEKVVVVNFKVHTDVRLECLRKTTKYPSSMAEAANEIRTDNPLNKILRCFHDVSLLCLGVLSCDLQVVLLSEWMACLW
jgi:hypothetical protein